MNEAELINPELAESLLQAQQDIKYAKQDKENPVFKNGYASIESVIEAVKEPLNNNGIVFTQICYHEPNYQIVETVFIHKNGSIFRAGKCSVACKDQTPQSYGSSLTYARRYSLATALGLKTDKDDDDDANLAQELNDTEVDDFDIAL